MTITHASIDSPIGPLRVAANDDGLCFIGFPQPRRAFALPPAWREGRHRLIELARSQLDEYFAGERQAFDLPLAPRGTPFQQRVWQALAQIPFGQTRSYAQLAGAIGQPTAMRAVGAANGRNPLPIVVPCHRVIGADGSLTGFGGGLPAKQFLLRLEGVLPPDLAGA
jgi:methylated-DNA-[protein]-cysteine S-methyltransferase